MANETDLPITTDAPDVTVDTATSEPSAERIQELAQQSMAATRGEETTTADPATDTAAVEAATTAEPAATAAAAFDESAWVTTKFGEKFKTADELAAAVAERDTLATNQLTDDHRATLALLSDAGKRREYLRLTDADYTAMPEADVLRENFLRKNSQFSAEEGQLRYEQWLNREFPGAAGIDPDHPDFESTSEYEASKKLMGFEAERARQELSTYRDEKTAELLKGALPAAAPVQAAAPDPEAEARTKAEFDAHIAKADELVGAGLDLTVDLPDGGKAVIGAGSTPEEVQAVKEAMYTPMKAIESFLYPDGKEVSMENLGLLAAFLTQGKKLFTNAVQVGRDSTPPHVELDKLTNAGGVGAVPAATLSVQEAIRQTTAGLGTTNGRLPNY